MKGIRSFGTCLAFFLSVGSFAQETRSMGLVEYDRAKAAGELSGTERISITDRPKPLATKAVLNTQKGQQPGKPKGGGSVNQCDLWQEPDGCPLAAGPADDNSSGLIPLPFDFNFYGTIYNGLYVNNNGNVSFVGPYGAFSSLAYPNAEFVMIAPFWGDVDTGSEFNVIGEVVYCINDQNTRIVITWSNVGYFNEEGGLRNTFQLILTNGFDPLLGAGNNVAFVYQDMQWTTGAASQGVNGFGGIPATVGANLGDGVSYIQIGRFDHPGVDYDGPEGVADGVDWLDFKTFVFSTEVAEANVPPLASGSVLCDTIIACEGTPFDFNLEFYSPEPDQTTTITVNAPTLSNLNIVQNTSGVVADLLASVTPGPTDIGPHAITVIGTDSGTPVGTTIVNFVLLVVPNPTAPPMVTGDATFCSGSVSQINASGNYISYEWSNGMVGPDISVSEPGLYTVTAFQEGGQCPASSSFQLTELPSPQPVIVGPGFACGGDPSTLTTSEPYATYDWSNFATAPSIDAGSGTYLVTVTADNGCSGISEPFTVTIGSDPQANFGADLASPQLVGTTVNFTDLSTGSGGVLVGWSWNFGLPDANSQDPSTSYTFSEPGEYVVTLTITAADGCQDQQTASFVIYPESIVIPNVFTPNNDNKNDTFFIENGQYFRNTLKVFNRWGQEVFGADNYRNAWRANGLSEGTYYYVFTTLEDSKEYTGHVTILR